MQWRQGWHVMAMVSEVERACNGIRTQQYWDIIRYSTRRLSGESRTLPQSGDLLVLSMIMICMPMKSVSILGPNP